MIIHLLTAFLLASPAGAERLVQLLPESVSWNLELNIRPLEGHVFNLKSPNRCGDGKLLQASEEVLACQFTAVGQQELEVFVCDQEKTFCKRELIPIKVQWPNTFWGLWALFKSYFS